MTTAIIFIFIAGYLLIAMENWTKVNKAAVALLMAVLSWTLYYMGCGASADNVSVFTKALGETSEILFFLLGAMVIVEVVDTNGGFDFVRGKLVSKSKVGLLWKLTFITFFLSAVLDNMTTAIIMVMIIDKLTSDRKDKLFYASMVILSANSGGAFSPIGDVTTIMLWVKGNISTFGVIRSLLIPSLVSVLVPAVILSFLLKGELIISPKAQETGKSSEVGITHKERTIVFCIGVGAYPEKHFEAANMETDILNLKKKVDAGSDYIITQMFFDNKVYYDFVEKCRAAGITVPIIPGLKPLTSLTQQALLPKTFHIDLPMDLAVELRRCQTSDDVKALGVEWAIGQARELKAAGVPSIHFYSMNAAASVEAIAKAVY